MAARNETGAALLVVLLMFVILTASAATFIWYSNRLQTAAGARLRASTALQAAEAGVHRALEMLELMGADARSRGREWSSAGHSETLRVSGLPARFTVTVDGRPGGALIVTSAGDTGGTVRWIRARVHLASPALLAGLYGSSVVRLERPPAAITILPYGAGIGDRPWIHIAAGQGIDFATPEVSINNPAVAIDAGPGPVDGPGTVGAAALRSGPVRLLLARDAGLAVGPERHRVDVQQLRAMGIYVEGVVIHHDALPPLPAVDRSYYQGIAAANAANRSLNEAAGRYAGDDTLARKRDSVYEHVEFERVLAFLNAGPRPASLTGMVYLKGGLSLAEGRRLRVVDGGLVAENTVFVDQGASLEVVHSAATRTLPGILVLDDGALVAAQRARLRIHGLVYAARMIDLGVDARVDIVGAVLGSDPEIAFRSYAGSVVIRYDPAVMGTPGLRLAGHAPVAAWVAAWEEVP